jgi:3-oxoacyl-[acyl-carrier-protein] synthase-3
MGVTEMLREQEGVKVHTLPATMPSAGHQNRKSSRVRTLTGVQIIGMGSYVPARVVTNEELQRTHGLDPAWIVQRTGIRERRYAAPHQATSDLCIEAAIRAIESSHVDPAEIDFLIVATFTPDMSTPASACIVQDRLGLNCGAMDLQAACSGFVYALVMGMAMVASGQSQLCLVIGGDCNSRVIDPNDPKTFPLFGDGAGAVLLAPGAMDQGFLAYRLGSDGSGGHLLFRPACGSRQVASIEALQRGDHYLKMDGRAVFRWAINIITDSAEEVLRYTGLTPADISLVIPHQANTRIINAAMDVVGFPREKVFQNLDRYGNTSSASIPIAMDEARAMGYLNRGDKVLITGFGAGLTWGTGILTI